MIGGLDDVYDLVNGLKPIKGILVSPSLTTSESVMRERRSSAMRERRAGYTRGER